MIDVKECRKRYSSNPILLKRSISIELSKHNGENCICSFAFTRFMETKKLGKAPITTKELVQLLQAL